MEVTLAELKEFFDLIEGKNFDLLEWRGVKIIRTSVKKLSTKDDAIKAPAKPIWGAGSDDGDYARIMLGNVK